MQISLENLYVEFGRIQTLDKGGPGLQRRPPRAPPLDAPLLGDFRIRSSNEWPWSKVLVFEKINWKKSKVKKNAVLIYMEKSTIQLGMARPKN